MEYTVNSLAKIAGISPRTLRFYSEIGLLRPARISSNGYRIYGLAEIDLLQQIMFYKELELPLEDIKKIIYDKNFNFLTALNDHKQKIIARREQLSSLLLNVDKTIKSIKGEVEMTDIEKFNGFKETTLKENEEKFGLEIREKYGEDVVSESNKKFMNLSKEDWGRLEEYNRQLPELVCQAMDDGNPASEASMKMVEMHRNTICMFADYPKEVYLGLTQMYCEDERFKAHYEKIRTGATEFLRDAAIEYMKDK